MKKKNYKEKKKKKKALKREHFKVTNISKKRFPF